MKTNLENLKTAYSEMLEKCANAYDEGNQEELRKCEYKLKEIRAYIRELGE
jgi:hypothetical protein